MNPEYIIAAPFTIYVAPVGTAFPAINAAPAGTWFKLGTSGDKDYEEDGVTVTQDRSVNIWRGAGSTAGRKAFATEESLALGFSLADLTPEQHAKVLDDAAVTTVAAGVGVAGEKSFSLYRGLQVEHFAVLARGMSTVDNDLAAQYEVATAIQDANQAPVYTKGTPANLAVQYQALDPDGDGTFGTLRTQTAVPTG